MTHILGLDNGNSTFYLFWSGIGSDLAYLSIIGIAWHHMNCHTTGCWRIGRTRHGETHCRKHRTTP